jgi:plastocyanin
MFRPLAIMLALALAIAACTSPSASSTWSYGPTLEPTASGSAEPSGPASAAPSPSATATAAASPSATASAGPRSSPGASGSPAGEATAITIGTRAGAETEFEPDELSVPAGAPISITFQNKSSLPHNLTFQAPINVASGPIVNPGASENVELPAQEPGDYAFVCTLHPGMAGTLTVEAPG